MVKIFIVIPNFNGLNLLINCLNSLENINSHNFNLSILIIDNGSKDGSVDFLKNKFENADTNNISNHMLIINENNLGFAKAVNQGIEIANKNNSDYICLLNNDTEVKPDFLDNLFKTIEKDENIFSVGSKMLRYDNPDLIDDAGDEYTLFGWTKKSGDGVSIKHYTEEREIFSACGGATLYKMSILNKICYFDENFFAYMEDVDIGYRARIFGYKNLFSPNAIVYHHGSASSGSKYNEFKIKLAARNNVFVIYKNMPILQIILNIGFLLFGFFIKYLFFAKKGYGNIYLEGLKEGIKDRKKLNKIKFRSSNLKNYLKLEWKLIANSFKLIKK
ncbi:N-acetylglucosaminyl-diphospho-decaprenol L-rhamnosyltransferase [Methanobrevibacter cuticularis]|uniref:N-acetylglucosaminyl-diphospho-decaprenol L-rhamnosyltransferase n=1 Tax=Methanobrevibacter cuticularis TaxID=47311 RepID=A0A166E053_9EURY|nr:glycosyltransferase family 2 protein [Methanobrevibacter cuticularis]KZX16133.1 N-acetylglucosaminyl-diphospho-decaprenol L-rhamnosyltransferase [Methanobrevibacter cuticularis]